ncbi:uncharacterized protein LOC122860708 [Aphidius gifuensis]|nr:uncharacterized protein LOC122860708 [Aphidius gifuensis]XP_044020567.1 uncharacterized protein LOC122860708 [Aphidius gifuensis]XP_044020568.1 uncharacterized protein LOC122860708 [Aphidius gifuensis]XP_044020569.1 uncharacterized protein LOC122860708 [Aphidius gifuensis]
MAAPSPITRKIMSAKRHIDDEQPDTIQAHFESLLMDEQEIDDETEEMTIRDLPEWYNEKLFKTGQNYCKRNRLAVCSALVLGVLTTFILPEVLKLLIWTKQSGTPCSSFRRYLRTILHIMTLNSSDINDPESSWWKSLNVIRWKHGTASRKSGQSGPGRILNRDMAIAQFSFIGYILIMPDKFGLTNEAKEREGFNHLWKVIGHLLGIPDKFNICRKNEGETTQLCHKLQDEIFIKYMKNEPEKFKSMAHAYLEGAWYIDPTLDADSLMYFWYNISGLEYKKPLGLFSQLNYKFRLGLIYLLGVPIVGDVLRFLSNYYLEICLWSATNFNILAWLRFGKSNTKINLHPYTKKIGNTTADCK